MSDPCGGRRRGYGECPESDPLSVSADDRSTLGTVLPTPEKLVQFVVVFVIAQ